MFGLYSVDQETNTESLVIRANALTDLLVEPEVLEEVRPLIEADGVAWIGGGASALFVVRTERDSLGGAVTSPYRRDALVRRAEAAVAKYPQYRGHFTRYQLTTMRCAITMKGGLTFQRDELVIFDPASRRVLSGSYDRKQNGREMVTVWSNLRECDVSVFVSDTTIDGARV